MAACFLRGMVGSDTDPTLGEGIGTATVFPSQQIIPKRLEFSCPAAPGCVDACPQPPPAVVASRASRSGLSSLTACAAPSVGSTDVDARSWPEIRAEAQGQTVSLWMWGGDPQGNAYVDDVLAPAAKEAGVTLRTGAGRRYQATP